MLAQLVPGPLVRFFAGPYIAGDHLAQALDEAAKLLDARGITSTLDLLGEGVTEQAQVDATMKVYEDLLRSVGADSRFADPRMRPSVSVKPSALTCGEREEAFKPLEHLAAESKRHGVALTIDMEDRHWTDATLDISTRLFAEGFDVGTVLQTRLHRTEADLERIPPGMRIRLVIGIYPEPPEAAVTDKTEMKERLLTYGARLLDRGARVEVGTHDDAYIERFVKEVAPRAPERVEIQMLLGVPRDALQKRVMDGTLGPALPVRLYVPFAMGWKDATAYLRRRIQESPSMMWLVLRNLYARR